MLEIKPNTLIVFEGLDKAGKSTQIERLQQSSTGATFAHMPTGFRLITKVTRELLEDKDVRPLSSMSTQLLHLACHAESMGELRRLQGVGALVLDRWWWSAMAYGWFGGVVAESGLDRASWENLIAAVWRDVHPDLVLVFEEPFEEDENNVDGVLSGYRELVERTPYSTFRISHGTADEVEHEIANELLERGLAVRLRS